MQIQRVNRDTSTKIYVSVTNKEGATITTGLPVSWAGGASMDANQAVIANAAADYPSFIGVAVQDIPNNEVGRVQIMGYVNSVLISHAGTSVTITAGDPLIPAPSGFYSGVPAYATSGCKVMRQKTTPTGAGTANAYSGAGLYGSALIVM